MESVLNNQDKNIIALEEVKDLEKIEPLTEQDQSPAILTEVDDHLPLKTNEEAKSELETASKACKTNDALSADNDKHPKSDVLRASNVLEQKEAEEDIEEKGAKSLLGFEPKNPINISSSVNEELESTGILKIPKCDEIKSSVDNQDGETEFKETLDATKQDNSEPNVTDPNTGENQKDEVGESADATEQAKKKKNRLTSNKRKRYRWLLKIGISPEEARQLAEKSRAECRVAIAKKCPDETLKISLENKEESTASKSKEPNPGKPPKKYAILSNDYPHELLTPEQLSKIQSSIMDKIVTQKPTVKPKFLGTEFKDGYMIVSCADKPTTTWLVRTTLDLQPWPGASLNAIPACNVCNPLSMVAEFPDSVDETNQKILDFIRAQNEELNVTKWKIRYRKEKGKGVSQILFLVDEESMKVLKARDFKINYKFDQLQFIPRGRLITHREFATETPTIEQKPKEQKQLSPLRKKPKYEDARPQFARTPARFGREPSRHERQSSSRYNLYTAKALGNTSRANPSLFDHRY